MGLEQYKGDMAMCCRCSCCKFIPLQRVEGHPYSTVCPSIARFDFHAYSGGGRLNIGTAMLDGSLEYTDKLLDIVYNCQMCGACGVSCNYAMDMQVQEPINEIRIRCVGDGKTHPALDGAIRRLRKQGSMVPASGPRGAWASGLGLKNIATARADVLLHVGCLTSYDKSRHALARAAAKILRKGGVDFAIAGDDEACCGGRAYQMGYERDFLRQARKNMAMIKKAGVRTVVTACADGYQAFKVLYDKYGLKKDLEVLHITEYIDRLLQSGELRLRRSVDLAVTYHDPCRLGRLGEPWIHWEGKKMPGDRFVFDPPRVYRRGTFGVYEPPRNVLRSIPGLRLSEMTRIKEYAWCCGAGGGVLESNPEFALWTARERMEEAASTGAAAIVTACPWCEKIFRHAAASSGCGLEVYDIVELVARAL